VSLGLNLNQPAGIFVPEPRHKSAGLAFGLSLLVPGVGQLYCGKMARGGMTLAFWLLALIFCFAGVSTTVTGMALVVMLTLWIFSFLDAYFTAIEINQGRDDRVDEQNPRVAVTLNFLTAGFGYFYLGEQTKGLILFGVTLAIRVAVRSTGFWGISISLALAIVQLVAAVDAYRIARRRVEQESGEQPVPIAENALPASRLPVEVPVVLACFLPFGLVVLLLFGLAIGSVRSGKRPGVTTLKSRAPVARSQTRVEPQRVRNDVAVPVVDFATAVQDVQRVQRKAERRKVDIPDLTLDASMLSATLNARETDASDAMVAHYYRAVALALINGVHKHEGEPMDVASARMARADLDKVIKADRVFTYVPEVSRTNAEYWAGSITRNQLHDEQAAYSYWEKCAADAHAGCMNIMAAARVTGADGQRLDTDEALALHTSVYSTGTNFHCAGAMSAMNIAGINYFMDVRRPGDDELEWTRKADGLLDLLEEHGNSRNVCDRAGIEVDEFLFQLSKGHRDDNILQDALSRLDDDSGATRAVIQFISGAIDEAGLNSAVGSKKSPRERCSGYFDAMWYAELRGEGAMARRFDQHLTDIGKFDCGEEIVFAKKFKF
jgi:hypothetical protein